jgi:hypothetical protein
MGWIITLGILVLLAILPLGAAVRYNADGVSLKVIAGPIRIPILPAPQKDPDAEKAKKEKKKPESQKKAKAASQKPKTEKKEEKGGPITDFLPLVKTALDLLNSFRKKLRINHLELTLIMAGDDPCDLAVNYGRANAAMGNLLPLLERCFVIKERDIQVECDFTSSQTLIIARADITITLGWILGIVVFYGVRALKQFLKINKSRKGGASS